MVQHEVLTLCSRKEKIKLRISLLTSFNPNLAVVQKSKNLKTLSIKLLFAYESTVHAYKTNLGLVEQSHSKHIIHAAERVMLMNKLPKCQHNTSI